MSQFILRIGVHLSLAGFLLSSAIACAQSSKTPDTIRLFPADAPGEKSPGGIEADTTKPDQKDPGGHIIRLGNVSTPTITIYKPAPNKDTGAAVVVCPGGGYHILAMNLEGTEVCQWLNSIGVTGILLKYRVPIRPGDDKHIAPLQDAQRAVSLARHHAEDWKIDPKRIGILGFSAGGHLSAVASNNFDTRAYAPTDEADKQSCRPDFAILIYPAYLTAKDDLTKLNPDLKVSANTPPTFIVMTQDDPVKVENVLTYTLALKNAKVPVELHVYPTGGHGYGLRPSEHGVTTWPARAAEWMQSQGWLPK
jgi:acetyl esterase/lipase